MYGKKRIVITKQNRIIYAGGGSWINIGTVVKEPNKITARFVEPKNQFDTRLTPENTNIVIGTLKDIRKEITKVYAEKLGILV